MISTDIPPPEQLRWSGHQLQEYVNAWTDGKPVSAALYEGCPALFKEREGLRFINKQLDQSHAMLAYATALMFKWAIVQVCERLNVHPVDIAFSHDLFDPTLRTSRVGLDSDTPLVFQILLDKPSYSSDTLDQMQQRLNHMLLGIMQKRKGPAASWVYLEIDDVRDYPKGYSSPWHMGSNPAGLQHGLDQATAMHDNPQVLHAWRSQAPNEILTSAAASGGLAQKGELYLRWLDGKEQPQSIAPVDENTIEKSWPSAMRFFHMWAALGIRERTALREALSRVEPKKLMGDAVDLPDDFHSGL